MRYFISCSYRGTAYAGWQKQPGDKTIQSTIEDAMSAFLRAEIDIVGCGRTDAGVHARYYVFHFDIKGPVPFDFIYRLNRILPEDIALREVWQVNPDDHARFSAISRSYEYHLRFAKDPFSRDLAYHYPLHAQLDVARIHAGIELLKSYTAFQPFCKTGSDTPHYLCDLHELTWTEGAGGAVFAISANRFLRGMVRLVTGTLLNVGRGKIPLDALQEAMDKQAPLTLAESTPAHGLYLTHVKYNDVLTVQSG